MKGKRKTQSTRVDKRKLMLQALTKIAQSETEDADELRKLASDTVAKVYGRLRTTKERKQASSLRVDKKSKHTKKNPATTKDIKARERKLKQLEANEASPKSKLTAPAPTSSPSKMINKSRKKSVSGPRVLPAIGQTKKMGSHRNQA